jgi:hypothetical protein
LVDDAGTRASYCCGWQGSGEDKAGCVGPDHVDKVARARDVATNSAVCFAESA